MPSRYIALLGLFVAVSAAAESKNGFILDDALIPLKEIRSGGPGRDGIPSLDNPVFVMADKASFLRPNDRILGVDLNGVERAYPIRILNYHEIVNDTLGGQPIVITYCPLCGSGMAFDSSINGKRLEFGVSGLLYNSDVLLYDRQSGSLWSQIMSTAVTGNMKGTRLDPIRVSHTTWRDWQTRHPDTEVLSTRTGFRRNYKVDPYPNYGRNGQLYFPVAVENRRYPRKSIIMGLEIDGRFKAYPFNELKKNSSQFTQFTDEFQGEQIEVYYDDQNQTARILDAHGNELPTLIAFWFAWYAFHPDTEIHTAK
jgi:hypothetical protein